MAFWSVREELSQFNRLRRSYYELLRDELDQFMLDYSLIQSYQQFADRKLSYPFIEKRELKPRARIPGIEYECQKTFLVIFVEDVIPANHKKYIRFFDVNKPTKTNLLQSKALPLPEQFDRTHKYLDSVHFYNFMNVLMPVDYALLIQRDPSSHSANRYSLTHYHVRIDWPIADAAEDLAQNLRYISKDLYEKGDKYAELVQRKLFEYYGMPFMVGGRRTAAMVAAQYLKRIPCITTVYAGSSESRTLYRISERGVSKAALVRFTNEEIRRIAESQQIPLRSLRKNYVVADKGKTNICIFQATYSYTAHARPPEDGKLREINPDVNWLTVGEEHLLPKPGVRKYPPINLNLIYT
ncbi:hypothetical protein DSCO28_10670 [Desulfosarcina ovata subsp. sediminis]|uniref:Uncharacterized protein n=1 Tax=Desulfosarcina ovata subsp. sediminis TaxID=885957 RepID=A0A5K7ZI06_9BACT|nr:hypothetical protein [Desulfosarcina ovata]BBO80501.1 hypothetical protein DSCO28_10670 [Desulfosarcina ovata subsp. sediminis]